ncbi:MAG: hypothetical protein M1434_12110 [Chloroflexi bacterium]|nr:hypothetical protein [Chloroflexota bacterium]MCL5275467.1 hypothetical protein [Chloroflexota bacterium]
MTNKLTRRGFLRLGSLAGLGFVAGESLNAVSVGTALARGMSRVMDSNNPATVVRSADAAANTGKTRFYRLNDMQEFFKANNDNQFGIGFGKPWGEARLGEPAMVAANLGGFPFQPDFVADPLFGQVLDCNVHKLTSAEKLLLDTKGQNIKANARRLGLVGQSFASAAFHVYPPDGFRHVEFLVKLPMGIHSEPSGASEVSTGIDNTFVGVWILPDLDRLSTDLAGLQAASALSADDVQHIRQKLNDLMVEIDLMEAVGHSNASLSRIMSGVHMQGPGSGTTTALFNDRQFFYDTSAPQWLQFMADHNSPFQWNSDYLKITFDFAEDGHWRTYFNEIGIVDSQQVLRNSKIAKSELLRRIPLRVIDTPAGPVPLHYFIIFHAAAGGSWPGMPTAPNDTAQDGMRVAYLYIS